MTKDIISIVAIAVSPAVAVLISMWIQDRREKLQLKRNVFATLMATRPQAYSEEIVRAMNMIDVVFHDNENVRRLWGEYMEMLNNQGLNNPAGFALRDMKRAELLHEMAKCVRLGKEISHVDLKRCYLPIGLEEERRRMKETGDELLRLLKESHGIKVAQKEQSEKEGAKTT
jgi:hypothetical protein